MCLLSWLAGAPSMMAMLSCGTLACWSTLTKVRRRRTWMALRRGARGALSGCASRWSSLAERLCIGEAMEGSRRSVEPCQLGIATPDGVRLAVRVEKAWAASRNLALDLCLRALKLIYLLVCIR